MTDELKQLLQDADAGLLPVTAMGSVTLAVRKRLVRQRQIRRITAVAVVIAIGAAALLLPHHQRVAPVAVISPTPARMPTAAEISHQLAALAIEAEAHEQTAALLAQRQPSAAAAIAVAPTAPLRDAQTDRDRAALIMVYDADRQVKEKHSTDAIALYRRAIELFPQSHWADVARQRLKEIQA